MEVITKKIQDLDLKLIKTDKFKRVYVQVVFQINLDYSDIGAYNLLASVLSTRNEKYPNINEFNSYLEENYGMNVSCNYFNRGNVAIFTISTSSINSMYSLNENLLEKQIEVIKDCLFKPMINEEVLKEVKTIYIQKLKEGLNKKPYILKKKVNEILKTDNPYGVNIEGDIESINSVTLDKLKDVYNKLLSSDSRVYVCGNVDENELVNLFTDFNLKSINSNLLDLSYLKDLEVTNNTFESNFMQSAISLTYQCDIKHNDPLYYPLKIFLEMLNYDLFNIIRKEYNFCYYIYAISNNYLNTIEIVSEIESKNLDKIVELIDEIIRGYSNNFNDEEFNICKEKMFTYIDNSLDNPKDLIDIHFGFDFNKTASSIEELKDYYNKVTKENIIEVSKKVSLKMVSILKEANRNG